MFTSGALSIIPIKTPKHALAAYTAKTSVAMKTTLTIVIESLFA